jgi:hypothetical protein
MTEYGRLYGGRAMISELALAVALATGLQGVPAPVTVGVWDRLRTDYGEPAAQFEAMDVAALAGRHVGRKVSVRGTVDRVDVSDPKHARVYLKGGVSADLLHLAAMAQACQPGTVVTLDGILKQHGPFASLLAPGVRRDDRAPFTPNRP